MRVAVLGTGPTSIQALNTLLHESKNPSIFQISIYDFSFGPENTEVYQQPSLKKLNSNYALSVPIELQLQRAKVSQIWGSFARGGWSNIWGAAIYEHPDDNHQNVDLSKLPSALKGFYLARHEARRIPNFLDQTYEYHSECADSECSLRLEISSLAIRPIHEDAQFGCIQCAECLDGCRFGHIWNSEQVLNNLCREFNLNIEQGFVKYVKFERNSITITKESESEFSTKCHDLVICGLGAVQTAALLLRSKICPMSVLVRDSQMLTVPFMMRNRAQTGTFEARIALSEAVISGKLDVSGASGDFFSQLYGYSKSLDEVFLTKLPILRFVPKFFRKLFLSRIGIAMVFLSEEFSGCIRLAERADGLVQDTISENISSKDLKSKLRECFMHCNLRLLTFLTRKSRVGGGFHFGNIFSDSKLNFNYISGQIDNYSRMLFVDSSSLPRVSSRPITIQAMRNSERIIQNWLHCNNL